MDFTKIIKDIEKFISDVETNTQVNRAQTDLLRELTDNIFEIKETISQIEKDDVEIDNWQEKAIDDLKKDIVVLKDIVANTAAEKKLASLEKKLEKAIEKEQAQDKKIEQVDEDLEKTKLGNAKVDSAQSEAINKLRSVDLDIYEAVRKLEKDVEDNTNFRVQELMNRASGEKKLKRFIKKACIFLLQVIVTFILVKLF
jgi:hypothetical protein